MHTDKTGLFLSVFICVHLWLPFCSAEVKSGERYGRIVRSNGQEYLIPEVVKRGDLEIGRFEVTRAQYAAFDTSYRYEAGTDNYPANLITPDQAKGYAIWLSGITGQTYRLPNEDEVAHLYRSTDGENTLDYWTKRGAKTPSLTEVGKFKPNGMIFDLGGNVAEWVLTKGGKAKTLGGSADRPAYSEGKNFEVDPAFTGFRIVRGSLKKKTTS